MRKCVLKDLFYRNANMKENGNTFSSCLIFRYSAAQMYT